MIFFKFVATKHQRFMCQLPFYQILHSDTDNVFQVFIITETFSKNFYYSSIWM